MSETEINLTIADVNKMVGAIEMLFDETSFIFNRNQASQNWSFTNEFMNDFGSREQIATIVAMATISMESAADHLIAFSDLLKAPAKSLAPLTCARSVMEMSALACWLLDPTIDSKTRLGRTYGFRYSAFLEQRKISVLSNEPEKIEKIDQRIAKVEKDALELGFTKLRNKNGEICGIAQIHPTTIELIKLMFGKEFEYRLLSGVSHGHHWALQQTGFRLIEFDDKNGEKIKALTKEVVPKMAIYVGTVAIVCFSRVLVSLWSVFGWSRDEIVRLLDATFDQLNYSAAIRFWRDDS